VVTRADKTMHTALLRLKKREGAYSVIKRADYADVTYRVDYLCVMYLWIAERSAGVLQAHVRKGPIIGAGLPVYH
jgi:hypothetical protein